MMIVIGVILALLAITYFSIGNQGLNMASVKIRPDAIELLNERFADGEISYEEYRMLRNQLLK
ncbi:SHOCT domain-containing protein [Caproiciproducens sp.]